MNKLKVLAFLLELANLASAAPISKAGIIDKLSLTSQEADIS